MDESRVWEDCKLALSELNMSASSLVVTKLNLNHTDCRIQLLNVHCVLYIMYTNIVFTTV